MGGTGAVSTVSIPVAEHVFAGGRITYAKEFDLLLSVSPPETTWGMGPLVGVLLKQGRYGQLSLASGGLAIGGRRRTQPKTSDVQSSSDCWFCATTYETEQIVSLGLPLNAQFFFVPLPYFGVGIEGGFTVIYPEGATPLFDLSLHMIVRIRQ